MQIKKYGFPAGPILDSIKYFRLSPIDEILRTDDSPG